ncbi:hypothetical protein SERLA73DRAFT_78521 [Serpula lacrymans var. lacrymans S7.3]|uniref:Uncharacterized protein n=2 Tax=Serpula lacrymans var. lacrymans TaxID=341189 RepID=F8QDI2_SERL3|nr:uncharacterized protein SERLADRAFT_443563 [Serpula lacrymans var. lacrymans S7.9]EGN93653.1 hypothetical protein SERLA73DRAFT_78521 [Serpula lacrymans var. lacrymans S7.3]EGO19030.1 hypothetical protein SERLADRAFT_443563 [Serpula lacrymans var. lacrymans S7.9]
MPVILKQPPRTTSRTPTIIAGHSATQTLEPYLGAPISDLNVNNITNVTNTSPRTIPIVVDVRNQIPPPPVNATATVYNTTLTPQDTPLTSPNAKCDNDTGFDREQCYSQPS